MNRTEFGIFLKEIFTEIQKINEIKGNDYAGNEDVFANFKRNAQRLGLKPHEVWAVYFFKHIDAIETYLRDGEIKSEPIEGRIDDAILYLLLLRGMLKDEKTVHPILSNNEQEEAKNEVLPGYESLISWGVPKTQARAMMEYQKSYGLGKYPGDKSNAMYLVAFSDSLNKKYELTNTGWKLA